VCERDARLKCSQCRPVPVRLGAVLTQSPCTRQAELAEQLAEMGHVLSATPEGLLKSLETMNLSTLVRTQRKGQYHVTARVGLSVRPGRNQLLSCGSVQTSGRPGGGFWLCDVVVRLRGLAHGICMTVNNDLAPFCFLDWLLLLVQVPYAPGNPTAIAQRIDAIMGTR